MSKITPCLWFDHEGEDAARFYTGIFKNSKIGAISRYGEAGKEIHGKPGSVMTVAFELNGQSFTALNAGPVFKFNEAISLQIECETQEEVDYYWNKLPVEGVGEKRRPGERESPTASISVHSRSFAVLFYVPPPRRDDRPHAACANAPPLCSVARDCNAELLFVRERSSRHCTARFRQRTE